MGLLRRHRRPPPPPPAPPGDWIDALHLAMQVDPSIRPTFHDRPPLELPHGRGWIGRESPGDVSGLDYDEDDGSALGPIDYDPIRLADDPDPPSVTVRPPSAEKPWLIPVPATNTAVAEPAAPVSAPAAAPAAVEALFYWLCRLNRLRRAGGPPSAVFDAEPLRAEADWYLATIATGGAVGRRLREPLASVVDLVMTLGGLPVVGPWRPLGGSPPDAAYRAAAEAAIADPAGLHDGTWGVHHAALSLVADLVPDGAVLLSTLDAKLAHPPTDARICPAAYTGVFDAAIARPAGQPVRAVVAAAIGLLLLAVTAAVLLNLRYAGQIRASVDAVDRAIRATATFSGGPEGRAGHDR